MIAQKFQRGWRVRVADKMPDFMSHFEAGFEAIVQYTYAQCYGGDDFNSYSLIQLSDGKPVDVISWYDGSQLTLVSDDRHAGLDIIEAYEFPAPCKDGGQHE